MKNLKRTLLTFFVLLFVVMMFGCTPTPSGDVKVTEIAITGNATMLVGETQTLAFEVKPTDATNKEVEWSTSAETVATVDNAIVTAISAGSVTITAKAKDGDVTGTFTIVIEEVVENKLTAENIKGKLQDVYDTYKKATKACVKVTLVNGESTLVSKLSFEISDELYKALSFEQSGNLENAVYVKDEVVYMSANGVKQKYDLDESENATLVSEYGIEALLKKAVSYYGEAAFFNSLTLANEENGQYVFELDITKYSGTIINTNGKDKIELVVVVADDEIKSCMIKVSEGEVINSILVEYLGFNETITYPEDLSDYE